jgi:hypothetical protein
MDLCSSSESHRNHLARYHQLSHRFRLGQLTFSQDFVRFSFTNTLYRKELFLRSESDSLDGVISSLD